VREKSSARGTGTFFQGRGMIASPRRSCLGDAGGASYSPQPKTENFWRSLKLQAGVN